MGRKVGSWLHPVLLIPVKKFRSSHKISKTVPETVKSFSTGVSSFLLVQGESLYLSIL